MAVTDSLMVMDGELSDQIDNVRTRFNASGVELHLFTDDVDPTPEDVPGDYTSPVFTGYAAIDLEDEWTEPARDLPGVWSMQTPIYTFEITDSGDSPETIQGIRIESGGNLLAAGRLPAEFELSYGGSPLRIRVVYTQYAALVLVQLAGE